MYENELTNIQRKFSEYIKTLQLDPSEPPVATVNRPDLAIGKEGVWPVMPPLPVVGVEQTHPELEDLIRRYLAAHYCK
jgi:hypothetical protein